MAETNEIAEPQTRNVLKDASPDFAAPQVTHLFRADLEKFYKVLFGTPTPPLAKRARLWVEDFGLHCVAAYRFDRYAQRLRRGGGVKKLLGTALTPAAMALRFGMELVHHTRISAEIGPGFYIGHTGDIHIGPTRIGANFSVTHNVTIGVGHARGDRGIPVLGDDVWVGTGSVLAGKIRVGDGVTVMHGTMLTRDAPAGSLVGGNPGRVVMQSYANNHLLGDREKPAPLQTADGNSVAPASY